MTDMEIQELNNLYKDKGSLTTTIEIAQSRLGQVNKRIVELLNTREPKVEVKDEPAV